MTEKESWKRTVRTTALLTVALTAALVFGIIVLASGDWVPGTLIVVASVVALAGQARVIRRLCSEPASGPSRGAPAG